jgi:hypothetical protein
MALGRRWGERGQPPRPKCQECTLLAIPLRRNKLRADQLSADNSPGDIEGNQMAKADRKHHGPAAQGKGDGTGAMTDLDPEQLPANAVLSNRDKAGHSEERGLDGKAVLTEQLQDHSGARLEDPAPSEAVRADMAVDQNDIASAQLDTGGEGATAKLGDIVEDKE